MLNIKEYGSVLRDTVVDWNDDDAPHLAGALAYYTLLSTAPLVVLCLAIAGAVFGEDAARGEMTQQVQSLIGAQAANAVQSIASSAHSQSGGIIGSIVGIGVGLFGASGVFGELQLVLNTIWGVKPRPGRGVKGFIRDRFLSFTMVLGVAFLLLVSLVVSSVLAGVGHFFAHALPGGEFVWQIVNALISFAVVTLLFALIFKVVPDVEVAWRDVIVGAAVTALLFTIGKTLLGLYLGKSSVASSYGAAGSIIALVVWVFYSAQILFLGAEFTQVYARRFGSQIRPSANAEAIKPALAEPAADGGGASTGAGKAKSANAGAADHRAAPIAAANSGDPQPAPTAPVDAHPTAGTPH
jgi:membrane protein